MKTVAIVKHFDHVQNRKSSSLFKFSHGGGIAFATPRSSTWTVLTCILFVKLCLIPAVSALVTWQGTVSCVIKGRQVSRFASFVFEIWVLRFRVLRASCFGLRFRVLRFRNYLYHRVYWLDLVLGEVLIKVGAYGSPRICHHCGKWMQMYSVSPITYVGWIDTTTENTTAFTGY